MENQKNGTTFSDDNTVNSKNKSGSDEQTLPKDNRSLLKAWWIFATVCFFVVSISIFLVVFYINTMQNVITINEGIPVQSSSDILNLSIPILTVFAGFLVSFLGMKRFENIDSQLAQTKKELSDEYVKKLSELNTSKKEMISDYAERLASLERVRDGIGQEIETAVATHIHKEGDATICKIADTRDKAEQDIKRMEDSVLNFLSDYSWLINNKEKLDKIRASSIQELFEMVSSAFADDDQNAVPRAIAVVRRTIENKELLGDADHFHNLGTILSKHHYTKEAVGICELGLTHFPNNMDLISCLTLYNAEIGDFKRAEIYATRLHEFDRSVWNWRAYTFYIDYCNYLSGTDDLQKSTLNCVADYQKYLPTEEKAYMAEYKTYVKYGMYAKAIEALKKAQDTLKVTPQCSTSLAEHYLTIGEYELCIDAASKALVGNAQTQETVDTGAIFGMRGLAKDAQILKKEMHNEPISKEEVISALKDLALAGELGYAHKNLMQRMLILQQFLNDSEDPNEGC